LLFAPRPPLEQIVELVDRDRGRQHELERERYRQNRLDLPGGARPVDDAGA
jgi:hypothetical protein